MQRGSAAAAAELAAGDVTTSMPCLRSMVLVATLRSYPDDHAGSHGEVVGPVVPLLALGGPDVLVGGQHVISGHPENLRQRRPTGRRCG